MAGIINIFEHKVPADFAGIVDDYVAKTQKPLRDARGNGHILDLAQRNVTRRPGDETGIDLHL